MNASVPTVAHRALALAGQMEQLLSAVDASPDTRHRLRLVRALSRTLLDELVALELTAAGFGKPSPETRGAVTRP